MKSTSYDLKEKSSRKLQSWMDSSNDFHVSFRTERIVISPKQQILGEITGRKRGLSSSKVFWRVPERISLFQTHSWWKVSQNEDWREKFFSRHILLVPHFLTTLQEKVNLCRSARIPPPKSFKQIAQSMVQQSKGHASIRYFALTWKSILNVKNEDCVNIDTW